MKTNKKTIKTNKQYNFKKLITITDQILARVSRTWGGRYNIVFNIKAGDHYVDVYVFKKRLDFIKKLIEALEDCGEELLIEFKKAGEDCNQYYTTLDHLKNENITYTVQGKHSVALNKVVGDCFDNLISKLSRQQQLVDF